MEILNCLNIRLYCELFKWTWMKMQVLLINKPYKCNFVIKSNRLYTCRHLANISCKIAKQN